MPNRESDKIRALYVRDDLVRAFQTASGSNMAFPALIAMDISTGDYFPVSLNIADNNENEKQRFVSPTDRLLGVFNEWNKEAERSLYEDNAVKPNTVVILATKAGFNDYAVNIAKHALGNEPVESAISDLNNGKFYSASYQP